MKRGNRIKQTLLNFGPLILVCSYIFYQSSQPAVVLSYQGSTNYFLHKLAHIVVYSAVFLTSLRAFQSYNWAVVFGFLYAISDEIHQFFVPTRTASVIDVLIDWAAILITFFLIKLLRKRLPKFIINFLRL